MAYELYTGHLAKVPMAAFAENILWRTARAVSGAGKYDSEWAEGIFVGISGSQVVISTPDGIHRSRDVRRLVDGDCSDKTFVDTCKATLKSYLVPEVAAVLLDIPVVLVPRVRFRRSRKAALHPGG